MNKKNDTKTLSVVYIILVVFIVMVGVMGIVGIVRVKDIPEDYTRILYSNIIAFAVAVIGAVVIVIYMNIYIERKLSGIRKLSERMSDFNPTKDIDEIGDDAFGRTLKSVNDAQFRLREVISSLQEDTANTSESAKDISEAVRKACERLELLNVSIMDYQKSISEKTERTEEEKEILKRIRKLGGEIGSISQFLDQVVVAADDQQEVSENFRSQLERFKL